MKLEKLVLESHSDWKTRYQLMQKPQPPIHIQRLIGDCAYKLGILIMRRNDK